MGGAVSFDLFGFPVAIHGSFLLIVGILGYVSFPAELGLAAAFVVIAVFAVLVHELGHAFAARSQGTQAGPTISLEGMAGLTRYRPARMPSRLQSIFISFAGPLAGIVLGAVVLVVRQSEVIERTGVVGDLFNIGLFTTFGWSAFNLLPIIPLDGGHIMTDMLPGDPNTRFKRAAVVSIAFSLVAGLALWLIELRFAAILLAMMAFQNMSILSSARRPAPPIEAPPTTVAED